MKHVMMKYTMLLLLLLTATLMRSTDANMLTDEELELCDQVECPKCASDSYAMNNYDNDNDNFYEAYPLYDMLQNNPEKNTTSTTTTTTTTSTTSPAQQQRKRQLQLNYNDDELQEFCCPKCVCNDCPGVMTCDFGEVAYVLNEGNGMPGSCCSTYLCSPEPNCAKVNSSITFWRTKYIKCECKKNLPFCTEYPEPEVETEYYCKPDETFMDNNGCAECCWINGEKKCQISACKAPTCANPRRVEGVCCPVCDDDDVDVNVNNNDAVIELNINNEIATTQASSSTTTTTTTISSTTPTPTTTTTASSTGSSSTPTPLDVSTGAVIINSDDTSTELPELPVITLLPEVSNSSSTGPATTKTTNTTVSNVETMTSSPIIQTSSEKFELESTNATNDIDDVMMISNATSSTTTITTTVEIKSTADTTTTPTTGTATATASDAATTTTTIAAITATAAKETTPTTTETTAATQTTTTTTTTVTTPTITTTIKEAIVTESTSTSEAIINVPVTTPTTTSTTTTMVASTTAAMTTSSQQPTPTTTTTDRTTTSAKPPSTITDAPNTSTKLTVTTAAATTTHSTSAPLAAPGPESNSYRQSELISEQDYRMVTSAAPHAATNLLQDEKLFKMITIIVAVCIAMSALLVGVLFWRKRKAKTFYSTVPNSETNLSETSAHTVDVVV